LELPCKQLAILQNNGNIRIFQLAKGNNDEIILKNNRTQVVLREKELQDLFYWKKPVKNFVFASETKRALLWNLVRKIKYGSPLPCKLSSKLKKHIMLYLKAQVIGEKHASW